MKNEKNLYFIFAIGLSLFGCTHYPTRGSVVMKVSDQEEHVCMGENEVSKGDKVTLFVSECRNSGGGRDIGTTSICRKLPVGTGEVVRPLNEHYSVVRANPGVQIKEGMIVEKGIKMQAE